MSNSFPVKRIAIFGSTGSIGTQALEVISANPSLFSVEILTAHNNDSLLIQQGLKFNPNIIVIGDERKYQRVKDALAETDINVFAGENALEEVAAMDCYDVLLAAIVGFAGLKPTLKSIEVRVTPASGNTQWTLGSVTLISQRAAFSTGPYGNGP